MAAAAAAGLVLNYTAALSMGEDPAIMAAGEEGAGDLPLYPNDTLVDYSQLDYPKELKYKPAWEMVVKTFFYVLAIILALVGNVIVIVVVAKNARMHVSCGGIWVFFLNWATQRQQEIYKLACGVLVVMSVCGCLQHTRRQHTENEL